MKTITYYLITAAAIGIICSAPVNAQNINPRGTVLVPESSGIGKNDRQTMIRHTRVRILSVPNAATPALYAQFNTPAMIKALYNLPSTGGSQAIAIVDAYHYPTALADFNAFSQAFGLPVETSKNPTASWNQHFQVVYAKGYQPPSGGAYIESWNLEEALDIEWAHAMAPNAKIYLVEANSASNEDLNAAIYTATAQRGVKEVSMSWGGSEAPYETWAQDYIFKHNGVVFFASGGDSADQMEYPAASPNVVACGGTSINRASDGTFMNQTAWNDTGCGPSAYETRPAFQNAVANVVGNMRGVSDLSFVADPNTGVYVYDSTPIWGEKGWWILGGTSVSSPSLAGIVNLAASSGNGFAASTAAEEARIYGNLGNPAAFTDVTSGTDGVYSAAVGYDFVTGVGTPNSLVGK
jgi:subtilase family serine protease